MDDDEVGKQTADGKKESVKYFMKWVGLWKNFIIRFIEAEAKEDLKINRNAELSGW